MEILADLTRCAFLIFGSYAALGVGILVHAAIAPSDAVEPSRPQGMHSEEAKAVKGKQIFPAP